MTTFDHGQIDEVIHASRLRVAVLAALATVDRAEFTALRDLTKSTDGNIGMQLRKLEEAGYVVSSKRLIRRWRVTDYALTPKGRKAFRAYLDRFASWIEEMPTTSRPR